LFGVTLGARTAVILAIGKIVPLIAFVVVGVFFVSLGRALAVEAPQGKKLGEAALLILFAYAGFENTAAPAGEHKNPRRDVPFALLCELALRPLISPGVRLVAGGPPPAPPPPNPPPAAPPRLFLGGAGGLLLTAGAAISILGTNSNTVLAGPRYLYA